MKTDVKYRKDYAPTDFEIESIHLTFELACRDTLVTSVMQVKRRDDVGNTPLVLDGEDLKLVSVKLNDETYENYELIEGGLKLPITDNAFKLEIQTSINPRENKTLSGLYQSSKVFCTQCEAEGFRRITYYLDRPDVMTLFTTKIIADKSKSPVMLSNGNLIDSGDLPNGMHYATWEDPHKKPCYLFALVSGDLQVLEDEFITRSGRKVDLKIYVKEHLDQCHHAMSSLKHSMKWDEDVFDREYDLDIFNIVAVDDFNMGAMENKSLNIFNTKYILANTRTATDLDFQNILDVVGHEYFHNWTGNRITCRDWFQLSLKEGLTVFRDQEFTADFYSRPIKRIEDVNAMRCAQFPEDASPMAHPIRPDSYIEMNNFYTATVYNKGGEVIRMQQTILGKDGFKRGMDLYFERHDGQAVTCEDFVVCMEDANKADLKLFRNWYCQDGTPVVDVTSEYNADAETYTLHMKQHCPDSVNQKNKKPYHIPVSVGLLSKDGTEIASELLHLTEAEQSFTFENIESNPIPSLLRDFSAPVKLHYDYSNEELIFLASHDGNAFNRYDAMQKLFTQAVLQKETELDAHIEAIRKTLTSDLDSALIAEAVKLPAERAIAEEMDIIDVDGIYNARTHILKTLATQLEGDWKEAYTKNQCAFALDPKSMAKRRLKNTALQYLAATGSAENLQVAWDQFESAENMTDKSASFIALLNYADGALREKAIESFYADYKDEPLTLNKWFQYIASSSHKDTCEHVEKLMSHPDFAYDNPNKVYALILMFSVNQPHFHRQDGKGYEITLEALTHVNKINPQVAARLAKSLMNFKHFDEARQAKMKATLETLMKQDLCKDVYEIASKALA